METLEINSEELNIEIKYTKGRLLSDSPRTTNLLKYLRELKSITSLTVFSVQEDPPDSKEFSYEFTTQDGRTWSQIIKTSAQEAAMTFNVPDFWRLSEFVLHRPIRDEVIAMIAEYGVTEISVTW